MSVETSELVVGPADQRIVDRRVDAEEYLTATGHV
jgi:hypothetical protein